MTVHESVIKQQAIEQVLKDLKILNDARLIAARYGHCHIQVDYNGAVKIVEVKDLVADYIKNEGGV